MQDRESQRIPAMYRLGEQQLKHDRTPLDYEIQESTLHLVMLLRGSMRTSDILARVCLV